MPRPARPSVRPVNRLTTMGPRHGVANRWYDISVALGDDLPVWPGSPGVSTALRHSLERGDETNTSQLSLDVHSGTHVDAPWHVAASGISVEEMGLDPFIGPTVVIDTGPASEITAAVLNAAAIPEGTERLLLRTANSGRPDAYRLQFDEDYAALTLDGAEWLATRDLCLLGIDYLSIQRYSAPLDVHRVLLEQGIALLEGISLSDVAPGDYELICLPMRLLNVEGAPARAILLPRDGSSTS
jgi:arylformamidase